MTLAVSDPIARLAALKNCKVCGRAVSPEEAACARCGVLVHKPSHETWPAAAKWFAVWDYARANRFHPWRSEQESWELLIRDVVNGTRFGTRPNRYGLTVAAPIEVCLPRVTALALAWREQGAPFFLTPFTLPQP